MSNAKDKLKHALEHLEQIDLMQVRIIPEGANEPLPIVPTEVTITSNDVEKAVSEWDKLMPEYAGLLDATITRKRRVDDNA